MLQFLGEAMESFGRLTIGRARFRRSDLVDIIFECGAAALPIVTLISFLVGLILAFVGAIQLTQFGAQIYVADLVGIAMAREMGALMTAIIMSGRTGAAFAAQLGTMQVNEEIDALTTFGLSPMDFLVLPRMIALILMMPLLCIYADLMGILGGALVGVGMLKLSVTEYVNETINGVSLTDFSVGIFKSAIFGVLVAICGCMRGIQCGRSASAVGLAATSAVVTGHRLHHRDRRHLRRAHQRAGDLSVSDTPHCPCTPRRRAAPSASRMSRSRTWTWPMAISSSSGISISPSATATSSSSWGPAAAARARC